MQNIVIVCEDLFGLEIYSFIQEINQRYLKKKKELYYRFVGFLSEKEDPFEGIDTDAPMIGKPSEWLPQDSVKVVMGIRCPEKKAEAVHMLKSRGAQFETVYAPWMLSRREWITAGEGCIICPYSAKPGMVIGDFVTIDSSMLSGHRIGDYSTVMRFANIAGESIGAYSYLGDHTFLAVGKHIGDRCMVADGSIVVKDLKNDSCVAGIPAKKRK